jgi:hypothetical protein
MFARLIALLLLTATLTAPISAAEAPDIRETLEGIWIEGRAPDKGDCLTARYDGETQLEFEFRKSGGRVMVFEPPDLFQALQIARIDRDGDGYTLIARTRDGVEEPLVRLRVLDHARIETRSPPDTGGPQVPVIAYRCGAPNRAVNESVPMDVLRLLTPEITLSASFPLAIAGVDDRDVCEGKGYAERLRAGVEQGGIQFELLGPVHYWVMMDGIYRPRKIVFDHVRKVTQAGPGVLKLAMQERARGPGWDAGGAAYELTIIDKGTRFEIPEIGKTFIRCNPPQPGAHRW